MAPLKSGAINIQLATEAATNPAENLPDGAATGVAVGITREEKHLADLLLEFVSRGQEDCSGFA